jgi:hypothetical protein
VGGASAKIHKDIAPPPLDFWENLKIEEGMTIPYINDEN